MKTCLLYKDKEYIENTDKKNTYDDLWFLTIINNLCVYDKYIKAIYEDCENLISTDINTIKYRQDILKDFIRNKNVMVNYYSFLSDLLTLFYNNRYEIKLNEITESFNACMRIMPDLLMALENMSRYFTEYRPLFKSEGLINFIDRFLKIFTLDYVKELREVYETLKFPRGMFCVASLDENLNPGNYELYDVIEDKKELKKELKSTGIALRNKISIFPEYELVIKEHNKWKRAKVLENPRATASSESVYIKETDKALLSIAPSFINVIDDIVRYLKQTRKEMAFYIGGINLYDKIMKLNLPICNPIPHEINERVFKCNGLYDLALALENGGKVVGNTLDSNNMSLIFITGANQGGKTTFLRSYGQAIIMMQLGLFVTGKSFESNVFYNIFTHFNKEEDKSMTSGKLDEELSRLKGVIGMIKPNSLMLFNESFQSTSEIEGSTIAYDIIRALNEKNIMVVMVSHMYHLYTLLEKNYNNKVYYLRASRDIDGHRSYKLISDKPLETSFALDLYEEIFKGGE